MLPVPRHRKFQDLKIPRRSHHLTARVSACRCVLGRVRGKYCHPKLYVGVKSLEGDGVNWKVALFGDVAWIVGISSFVEVLIA